MAWRRGSIYGLLFLCLAAGCGRGARFVPPAVPPGPYHRIVSLTPSVTEILFALGAGDRVVGVTLWCDYPEAARALPRVGDFLEPNLEALASLEPDLVILAPTGTLLKKQYDNLRALGFPVLVVWDNTLEETFDAVARIGRVLKLDDAAAALTGRMGRDLAREAGRIEGAAPVRVLWVVGHRPLVGVGPGTFQDQILARAGGINVLAGAGEPWPSISEEYVLRLDPEVIIDSAMGPGPVADRQAEADRFWRRLSSVRAVRESRVRVLYHDALYRPGPRMGLALRLLARTLHPGGSAASGD